MKVLASYSIKGGVGKTSAAVNLATAAADRGWRVLFWDLDPQGAATYMFRVAPRVKGGGRGLISRKRTLTDAVRGTDIANLDLVPADFRYRHLDLLLDATKRPTRRLRRLTQPLQQDYDWVFLDCAPSVSLVTEAVLAAADVLLVPVIPSTLSVRTVDQLAAFTEEIREGELSPEVIAFFSMYDRRKRLHNDLVEQLPVDRPGLFAKSAIPSAAIVERMGTDRLPLARMAPSHRATQQYLSLWEEIEARWPDP